MQYSFDDTVSGGSSIRVELFVGLWLEINGDQSSQL